MQNPLCKLNIVKFYSTINITNDYEYSGTGIDTGIPFSWK